MGLLRPSLAMHNMMVKWVVNKLNSSLPLYLTPINEKHPVRLTDERDGVWIVKVLGFRT